MVQITREEIEVLTHPIVKNLAKRKNEEIARKEGLLEVALFEMIELWKQQALPESLEDVMKEIMIELWGEIPEEFI